MKRDGSALMMLCDDISLDIYRRKERLRVLFVEDDQEIIQLYEETFSGIVFIEVLSATNGLEAIHLVNSGSVDIIVSDVDMPYMGGLELFRRVSNSHPEIPFVLVSGRSSQGLIQKLIQGKKVTFLEKPCEMLQVAKAILSVA